MTQDAKDQNKLFGDNPMIKKFLIIASVITSVIVTATLYTENQCDIPPLKLNRDKSTIKISETEVQEIFQKKFTKVIVVNGSVVAVDENNKELASATPTKLKESPEGNEVFVVAGWLIRGEQSNMIKNLIGSRAIDNSNVKNNGEKQ